jgi:hypothetical protein
MQSIAYKASSWWILEEKGSIPSIIQVHQQDKSNHGKPPCLQLVVLGDVKLWLMLALLQPPA